MIKSAEFIDKSIFNYIGEADFAVLLGVTGLCDEIRLENGVVMVQYNAENNITAVVAISDKSVELSFVGDDADSDELDFIIDDDNSFHIKPIDKKYLLRKTIPEPKGEKGVEKADFRSIKRLESDDFDSYREMIALKMLLKDMGKCEGVLISEDNQDIAGGFITFSMGISLITDVYTKEKNRNSGYGKKVVEKLLNCSPNENVYLISKENNLDFYKKCGFEILKEIDYRG